MTQAPAAEPNGHNDDFQAMCHAAAASAANRAVRKLTAAYGKPLDDTIVAALRDVAWNCGSRTVATLAAMLNDRSASNPGPDATATVLDPADK